MSTSTSVQSLQTPGDIEITELFIVTPRGNYISLDDYMSEINIYEDIFSNTLSGDIVLSDYRNLISALPILGDEYLVVGFKTPGFPSESSIRKTFRIISITDRKTSPPIYVLRFCSLESIIDSISPIFKTFSGKISDVAVKVFTEYLQSSRGYVFKDKNLHFSEIKTSLALLNETSNIIKFTSPGWGPLKIMNWLASKAIPKEGKACNFLFWESNKRFYFGSTEKIIEYGYQNKDISIGQYYYTPPGVFRTNEVNKKMFVIEELEILKTSDTLSNYDQGYYASRVLSIDMINKTYDTTEYDHTQEFAKYYHVSGKNVYPLYSRPPRNPATKTVVYTKHPGLFTDTKDNVNEKFQNIYGNRQSNLLELNNLKLKIVVPGRTDVEVGSLIDIVFPDVSPVDEKDITGHSDILYSGKYLITAIRHKINPIRHHMVMEVVKDSLQKDPSLQNPIVFSDVL